MTKKEKVKNWVKDHKSNILASVGAIGLLGTSFAIGRMSKPQVFDSELCKLIDPFIGDTIEMAVHAKSVKDGIKGVYCANGENWCRVGELGKLVDHIIDCDYGEGPFKPKLDSDVIGVMVIMNNKQ